MSNKERRRKNEEGDDRSSVTSYFNIPCSIFDIQLFFSRSHPAARCRPNARLYEPRLNKRGRRPRSAAPSLPER